MDRLLTMRIFLAVVDEAGFAPAARKLNISPPAVTRAITELEETMGVRLLTRTTRVVRVTDVGQRYATDCRRILADVAEAEQAATGTHAAPRGRITITASVLFGQLHVAPIVAEYLRRHPQADVDCLFVDRNVNLIDEGVDVAIRIGQLPDSSFQAVRVGQVRQVVCASPAYLAQHGTPTTPQQLQDLDIVLALGVTPSPLWRFETDGRPFTARLDTRMTTSTNDAAIRTVVAGFGITRVISYMVADHLAAGTLVALLPEYMSLPVPVHVLHHEGRHAARKVRAFLDLAIEMLHACPALK